MSDPLADLAELDGVPSALAAARDALDAVLRDRGMRRSTPEQSMQALVAGARASAELESLTTGVPTEQWVTGTVRMSTELLSLAALVRVAPGQVLARLHTLLAREASGELAGRLRADPEVGPRMAALMRLLGGHGRAPALVLAAVAHAEVAVVAPFGTGDGIVARALEHAVLVQAGLDPQGVLVPEAGHLAAGPGYAARLAGYADGSVNGVREWIRHCAQAVTAGAAASPLATQPRR